MRNILIEFPALNTFSAMNEICYLETGPSFVYLCCMALTMKKESVLLSLDISSYLQRLRNL
jgi:hypothetical protein